MVRLNEPTKWDTKKDREPQVDSAVDLSDPGSKIQGGDSPVATKGLSQDKIECSQTKSAAGGNWVVKTVRRVKQGLVGRST